MADVAIDADVASRLQKGTEPAWVRHHVIGARTWLTFVTVAELWKWAEVRVPLTLNRKDFADFASHEALLLLEPDG